MKKTKLKYQVNYRNAWSIQPMSGLMDTEEEAQKKLNEVREEMLRTWATPDLNGLSVNLVPVKE